MKKEQSQNKKNKAWISILGLVVSVVLGLIPYICVDFAMDFEKSPNTYLLLHSGAPIKNSSADVFCVTSIPIKDSKKRTQYIYSSHNSPFSNSDDCYCFDVGESIREKAFSEEMTYLFYDNSEPYFYPDVEVYVQVNYELAFIHNFEFHKWYRIDNKETKYVNPLSAQKIKKQIVLQSQTDYSDFYNYYVQNRTMINNNSFNDTLGKQKPKKSIDELLMWINKYRVKPISLAESETIKSLYLDATYS